MKAYLLYADRDVDASAPLPANESDLDQDLGLATIFDAMADGDGYLREIARRTILTSLTEPAQIGYRQHVLSDCLAEPALVRQLYDLAVEAVVRERKEYWGVFSKHPDAILRRSLRVLAIFVDILERVRAMADAEADRFGSEGMTRLFAMLRSELDDEYLATVKRHLRTLAFRNGTLVSAGLGAGNKGVDHLLHQLDRSRRGLRARLRGQATQTFTLTIADRDEAGMRALGELRERGINQVADALGQSTAHILSFFAMLRSELGFYVGCLNLHDRLTTSGRSVCLPAPQASGTGALSADGLYDLALAVRCEDGIVGNRFDADGKRLLMITGANQGGKSTFLRGLGLAHLMMQAGMFVGAHAFRAEVCTGVFTHYKREEDAEMQSGKLDEELRRMSQLADLITPASLLLCNESFAATNEREGSEIARQVIHAMIDFGVKVLFVTHLYDLSHGEFVKSDPQTLFLRADRRKDGRRTFTLSPGEPLPTSFGTDLYQRIFQRPAPEPPAVGLPA